MAFAGFDRPTKRLPGNNLPEVRPRTQDVPGGPGDPDDTDPPILQRGTPGKPGQRENLPTMNRGSLVPPPMYPEDDLGTQNDPGRDQQQTQLTQVPPLHGNQQQPNPGSQPPPQPSPPHQFSVPDPRTNRAVPMGPVIDISRLPRYGALAPPIARPLKQPGDLVEFDQATKRFVRNKGILREALEHKSGWLEDAPMRDWAEFTGRQRLRYVPVPPDMNRRVLPDTQGYRLRILRVNDLPVTTTYDGRSFEFQLGVSLYDEAYGTFYGNTVYSKGDGYDRNRAAQKNAIDLDVSFDVFYHTSISDPRCMAVVEVIMQERMLDGVVKGQYSLGWALLPLFKISAPVPGALPGTLSIDPNHSKPLTVPLVAGTPRYLLLRSVYNETLRPPKVLQNCSIMFQAEACPAMEPFIPLLPEDFLVTYSDVIPGLRRFDNSGQLSISRKQIISTCANPMLSPTYSVVLRRLQLAMPLKIHELLLTMGAKHGLTMQGQDMALFGQVPQNDHTGDLKYAVRVGVHNGRTFVGPSYELTHLTTMDVPGWKVLQVPAPDAVFDYVMGDVCTAIVVELVVTPPQALPPGMVPTTHLVGWTAFTPFSYIADDGSQSEVAVGVHRYPLSGTTKKVLVRDAPPLNWRSMLGDSMLREVPEPMVEFQLFETGRTPIPPPLRARFAAIEQQRAEEAALGERPLEEVVAAVPVPSDIAGDMAKQPVPPVVDPMDLINASKPGQLVASTQTLEEYLPERSQSPGMPIERERDQALADLLKSHTAGLDPHDRDQLRDLASAMQRQIELLTRAVDDLKEERKTMRNSIIALGDNVNRISVPAYMPGQPGPFQRQQGTPVPSSEEIRRLMEMPATNNYGDPTAFAGGAAAGQKDPGTAPSRVLLQQLYDAGMVDALPEDVQTLLRRRGPPRGPMATPADLAIEARDPRMASDIIVQFLAFRHHDTLNAPANLQSMYFTFQFYHFPPTTSDLAFLVQPKPQIAAPVTTGQPGVGPPAQDDDATASTRLLITNHPMKKGAGVVLKYEVDGSVGPLSAGQDLASAAYEAHMAFAGYLGGRALSVDVWDGESLLQIGTVSLELAHLLRQGREYSELLVELPIMSVDGALGSSTHAATAGMPPSGVHTSMTGVSRAGANDVGTPTLLSRGSVVMRVINIGREPRNTGPQAQADFDAASAQVGKRVKIRVKPAWEVVNGPIAIELANGDHPLYGGSGGPGAGGDPYLVRTDPEGRPVPPGVPTRGPGPASHLDAARKSMTPSLFGTVQNAANHDVAIVKEAILNRSHLKSARVRQFSNIMEAEKAEEEGVRPLPPEGAMGEDAFRRVQKQLLTDVSSARSRNKDAFIRDQLRRNMVMKRVVKPGYGEVVVYEHEFANPFSVETVFEVRISEPRQVTIMTRADEYKALKAAGARFIGTPSQPASGALEQEVMAGNRVYLQAGERITLPLKIQSLTPPAGYGSDTSVAAVSRAPGGAAATAAARRPPLNAKSREGALGASTGAAAAGGATVLGEDGDRGHTVSIEVVSVSHGHPVGVLELRIVPRPLIIDRTFRFYHAERSLMRQTVRLRHLPYADVVYGGSGAYKSLAVAASHPDVITGAGGAGLVGGAGDRDEVYIKYKCGGAPEITHFYVLVYADRLLTRPIEVWQVFVHALRKVDVRALIGQTSGASVVVRGASNSRRVAAYTSHPDELQVAPEAFVLVAGSLTEVLLSFRPVVAGPKDMRVHLVDSESRELVYALIVAAEGQGPLVTRTFEVELPAGTVANKKITYTNPYQDYRTFSLRSSQPWLVTITPPRLALPAGATRPLGLTFDARAATAGIIDVLVFVNDEDDRTEECFKVRVRVYR